MHVNTAQLAAGIGVHELAVTVDVGMPSSALGRALGSCD